MTARIIEQCVDHYFTFPQLQLNFSISDTNDRLQLVKSGIATLAVIPPENVPNEMDSKLLRPDRYALVASKKWKGRRLSEILSKERLIDFYDTDLTSINYLKHFNLFSDLKTQRLFVNNNEGLIKLLLQGVGFGTLTYEIAKPHLENGTLMTLNAGLAMEDRLALTWYPRHEMPNYLKAIIASIK